MAHDHTIKLNTSSLLKFGIGFDPLFTALENAATQSAFTENFPPFNIRKVGDTSYNIEIAIAGYAPEELDIVQQENVLTVIGTKADKDEKVEFLHRGIATRNFTRKFTLSNDVEVMGANIVNGILQIGLNRLIPEEKKPKKIPIGFPETKKAELLRD